MSDVDKATTSSVLRAEGETTDPLTAGLGQDPAVFQCLAQTRTAGGAGLWVIGNVRIRFLVPPAGAARPAALCSTSEIPGSVVSALRPFFC